MKTFEEQQEELLAEATPIDKYFYWRAEELFAHARTAREEAESYVTELSNKKLREFAEQHLGTDS